MIITATHVAKHLSGVTDEMIGRAFKCFDGSIGFYMVENSKGDTDQDGEIISYKVQYSKRGFSCTCASGKVAFSNVKHASGVCSHVRIALSAEAEVKAALAEMEGAAVAPKPLTAKEQEYYRQEEVRQSEQVAFMMNLPSRNRKA